jgi:hypothetical protein
MKGSDSEIVADGARRLRVSGDYAEAKRRITAEVKRRFEAEKKSASLWRRLWLVMMIRRQIKGELDKLFPPAALHFARTARF